jgi:hypothetical protein
VEHCNSARVRPKKEQKKTSLLDHYNTTAVVLLYYITPKKRKDFSFRLYRIFSLYNNAGYEVTRFIVVKICVCISGINVVLTSAFGRLQTLKEQSI